MALVDWGVCADLGIPQCKPGDSSHSAACVKKPCAVCHLQLTHATPEQAAFYLEASGDNFNRAVTMFFGEPR